MEGYYVAGNTRYFKSYSKKGTVLDHISFQMREGIYGLLGPNGAGKTTLMNIMTANLQPDGGCVMYNGEDIKKQGKQYRASLGYAPQQQWLYDDFRVTEYLHYMASLKMCRDENSALELMSY